MKVLRLLIVVNALFFLLLGTLTVIRPDFPSYLRPLQQTYMLRCLGAVLAGFGLVLLASSKLTLPEERRRLASRLAIADLMIILAGLVMVLQGESLGFLLFYVPLFLAAGLAWTVWSWNDAEEAADLAVPDEVRRRWLHQVGEAAAQEERNRLARDLHDSIKQQLFTINVSTAAAQERWERDPDGARAALADVRRSAKEAMVEMQALLHQLSPQALASAGLVEALREQCQALGYRTGAEVVLELGDTLPDDRLLPGTQETFFRIAQEALANVARHARARKVRVWLGREGESARLRVEDDGQGFDPAAQAAGMGLRNLRERTQSLQGTLEVLSTPGAGTTIGVTVPLTSPPPPGPSPIEKMLSGDGGTLDSLILPMVAFCFMRPLLESTSYMHLLNGIVFTGAAVSVATTARRIQQQTLPGTSPALRPLLRYLLLRNRALAFFLAAVWTPWFWRLGRIGLGWTIAGLAVALGYAALGSRELVRFHRASEVRSRWWHGLRFRPTAGGFVAFGMLMIWTPMVCLPLLSPNRLSHSRKVALLLPRPIGTAEALVLLFGVAVLVYIRTRQPRAEGALE